MIDFRYHLVSLISVFIALAVGIVLGAGPLRDTLADQLTSQVEALREEKDALRLELDDATSHMTQDDAFIDAAAPGLLAGTLPDYRVALVRLPGTEDSLAEALRSRVEQAGGTVVSEVELTDVWVSTGATTTRASTARSVRDVLESTTIPLPGSLSSSGLLAVGLAEALTEADPADPRAASQTALDLLAVLRDGDQPLLEDTEEVLPADLVLVLAPAADEEETETTDPETVEEAEAWGVALSAIADREPTVVAGFARVQSDLLVALRGTVTVSTVDGIDATAGQVAVPLALAAAAAGEESAAYGFGLAAQEVLPPRVSLSTPSVLVEPDPLPDPGATEESTEESSEEGTAEGAEPSEQSSDASSEQGEDLEEAA